ncbi:MAG: galactosyltransferase-related protein [Aeromicrobium erythreum]
MTGVAVVTVAHGRHDHLLLQQRALDRSDLPVDARVVVSMGDPWIDAWRPHDGPAAVVPVHVPRSGRLPLARARNVGVRTALETGADLVVLLDVDCVPAPGLVRGYRDAAATPEGRGALLCGPVAYLPPAPPTGYVLDDLPSLADPHPARPAPAPGEVVRDAAGHRLFWSLSFAVQPDTWAATGGFDEDYTGYGAEDTDLGQRAARAGVPVAWVGSARAFHQHHPTQDPPVQHLEDVVRNARRFAGRWGWWPMRGWLEGFVDLGLVRREVDGSFVLADASDAADPFGPPATGRRAGAAPAPTSPS